MANILIGFGIAFMGLLPPGMLNMTSMRVALEKGFGEAIKFAAGASIVVGIHSFIAFTFSKYIGENPVIVQRLEKIAIAVFFALAIHFYLLSRKKFTGMGKEKKGSSFVNGFLMSSMNMLGIPFYFAASLALTTKNPDSLVGIDKLFLIAGAMAGAFSLFTIYAYFSKVIKAKISFIAENINLILAILFAVLGVVMALK